MASILGAWRRDDLALAADVLADHFEEARRTGVMPDPWSFFAWAALRLRLGDEVEAFALLDRLVDDARLPTIWQLRAAGALWACGRTP